MLNLVSMGPGLKTRCVNSNLLVIAIITSVQRLVIPLVLSTVHIVFITW